MYDVGGTLPTDALDAGTSVLCFGPPLSGKRSLGVRVLAEGLDAGEGAVVVTAQQNSATLRKRLADAATSLDTARLAVVDCAAGGTDGGFVEDDLNASVSSPADLTGIGMAVTDALQQLEERGIDRVRLLVDSLSTLLMYTEFERVYRFCHVLLQRIDFIGGLAFATLDAETIPETEKESLRGLFDAVVEIDRTDARTIYRLHHEECRTDWEPVTTERPADPPARATASSTPTTHEVTSLHEALEYMGGSARTLTVFEPTTEEAVETVRPLFERHNVAIETTSSPAGGPTDFAVLHRDGDFHAAEALPVIRDAVALDGIEAAPDADAAETELLRRLETDVFSTSDGSVREMVRISRSIERTAWEAGTGTVHAGFQRLSRVVDEWRTHEVYESIADRGVETHLYGVPDTEEPLGDGFAVHGEESDEIADTWFVLFDDGPGRRRGLVCEERESRRYTGFWTSDASVVESTIGYLERTY